MNTIIWACVFVYFLKPIEILGVMQTKEHCEQVASQYHGSKCYPVNVTNHREILEQIEALNTILE